MTTGDDQPVQGVSGDPLDMRRGSNYGPPGLDQPSYGTQPSQGPRAGYGHGGAPERRSSRTWLLVLVAAAALAVVVVVLLLGR